MIHSISIKEKIIFINPNTSLEEDYLQHFEFYESKTNKLLGKVFKQENPYIYWFIPEPNSNLEIIKTDPYTGGGQKIYVLVCNQLQEMYKKLGIKN